MMNRQPSEDTMMKMREDFMLLPAGDSKPTFRTAHFLNPIAKSNDEPPFKFNRFSSSSIHETKEWPLKIRFSERS